MLDYYLDKSGAFSDIKYREWWISQHGKIVEQTPSKEKVAEFEKEVNSAYRTDERTGIKVSTDVTVTAILKSTRPADVFAFEDNPEGRYKRLYRIRHINQSYGRTRHDLICDNIMEVMTAIVDDYSEETSIW
jgi:hypothetical protein